MVTELEGQSRRASPSGLAGRASPEPDALFHYSPPATVCRLPEDFKMDFGSPAFASFTCHTTQEVDAVIEVLQVVRKQLPSTREAVAADFGLWKPDRPFAEQLAEFLA